MKPLPWTVLASFFLFFGIAEAAKTEQSLSHLYPVKLGSKKHIRVRIARSIQKLSIRGFDFRVFEKVSSREWKRLSSVAGMNEWNVECRPGEVLVKSGDDRLLSVFGAAAVRTPAGFLTFEGKPFQEELRIFPVGKDRCDVVNVILIEDYLDGLVNTEFSSRWSPEAVAAQIIAARTYAVYQIREARKRKASRFDVESTTLDQAYAGAHKESSQASRLVKKTTGQILSLKGKKNPRVIKAFYHSTCGGVTELPQNVWGARHAGFKKKVPCRFCKKSPAYFWKLKMKPKQLGGLLASGIQKVGKPGNWPKHWKRILERGRLLSLEGIRRDRSGRNNIIKGKWKYGKQVWPLRFDAAAFRSWVGPIRIRSTAFKMRVVKNQVRFWGKGNGHGVGMCQWGAKVMGEKGYSMASILNFYYPGAEIRKLW